MFTLPTLPFSKESMPQFCSAETFDFHHGKHHAAYVTKLNVAIENTPYADKALETVIRDSHAEKNMNIFNNAAQHWNHSFFWETLSPNSENEPTGSLKDAIERDFDSFEAFKTQFTDYSMKLFGSGWIWLVKNSNGKLEILAMPNAGTPVTEGKTAIITLDVWEHAYYIDYRNERGKYIDAFWNVVNWNHAGALLG